MISAKTKTSKKKRTEQPPKITLQSPSIDDAKLCVWELEQIMNPLAELCNGQEGKRLGLYNPVQRHLDKLENLLKEAKYNCIYARNDSTKYDIANQCLEDLISGFANLNKTLYYTKKEIQKESTEDLADGITTNEKTKSEVVVEIDRIATWITKWANNLGKHLPLLTNKVEVGTAKSKQATRKPRKSKRKKWSRPMTKSTIITILRLESVYKLNKLAKQGEYEIKQVGNNPQSWKIRIDKLEDNLQKKLR